MRRAAKVDENQPEIVAAFRKGGASVEHLHTIGKGCPDLVVGFRGLNALVEVKDGRKPPSQRKLTKDEQKWHDAWGGQVFVVECPEDAEALLRWMARETKTMGVYECRR